MLPWLPVDRRWLLGGVLFAGGVGLVRALTYRPKFDENSRVLVIGDSMARGMSPHLRLLAEEADLPFLAMAENGTRISQWANSPNLASALIDFDPTHVLVVLGTNDAYTQKPAEVIGNDAADLVELIEETDAHVIWIGAPELPLASAGAELDEDILATIQNEAPYYFDSADLQIPRGPDDLHPTARGYAGWAGAIWNWLT